MSWTLLGVGAFTFYFIHVLWCEYFGISVFTISQMLEKLFIIIFFPMSNDLPSTQVLPAGSRGWVVSSHEAPISSQVSENHHGEEDACCLLSDCVLCFPLQGSPECAHSHRQ